MNRQSGQFFLRERQSFTFPKKVYGNDHEIIDRVLKKYGSVERNLGVLLTGIKGSGKTVTAKKICDMSGLPTLIISEPYHGEAFIEFMTNDEIGDCAILIDEFEKIYNNRDDEDGDAGNEFLSVGFRTDNAEAKREALLAAGLEVSPMMRPNPQVRFFFVRDPAGVNVQFM